jgi:predicted nucleotidyltransferase
MMMDWMSVKSELLNEVKSVIESIARKYGIDIEKIVLFGSRARGDFREDSDWDFLIITRSRCDRRVIQEFSLEVRRALVDVNIIPEIIVAERDVVERYKDYTGYVYYYALSEGIIL